MKLKNWDTILTGDAALSLKEVGRLVTEARKRRGMSLVDLATRACVDRRTVSQLEAGSPGVSIGLFFQILSIFNLVKGIEEFLKPENDIEAAAAKVRQIRKRQKIPKEISEGEVNF
jgi:transcriptional regulator with XRE-family HTH domain